MEVFDIVATEMLTMRNILSRLLNAVKKIEDGFITIDTTNYNGIGVEASMSKIYEKIMK